MKTSPAVELIVLSRAEHNALLSPRCWRTNAHPAGPKLCSSMFSTTTIHSTAAKTAMFVFGEVLPQMTCGREGRWATDPASRLLRTRGFSA